ncbi:MAG: hypothetical protein ABSA03_01775 [Streptosporangiaceae bacterium]
MGPGEQEAGRAAGVSGTAALPAAGPQRGVLQDGVPQDGVPQDGPAGVRAGRRLVPRTPAGLIITAATLLGLGLRLYQLARPGHLLGVTEYDDGADFGSALRLIDGVIPYRDFITVQPPGITLLMVPAAVVSKLTSTAWAMAAGRILTVIAGAAGVLLGGLLVRHRGTLAVLVTCGVLAVYPGSVQSAHTVLLEPWLVLFCLAGTVIAFDGDNLAGSSWRLAWGGAALGFAGAIKVWAVIPVAVIAIVSLPGLRRTALFLAGVAAGFAVPVLPFAVAAPRALYDSVVVAQLTRTGTRTPFWFRIQEMTGLTDGHPADAVLAAAAVAAVALTAGACAGAWLVTRRPPPALEVFALVTAALVVASFLLPDDFYYHYAGFLAPFLALSLALPAGRLLDAVTGSRSRVPGQPGSAGRRPGWAGRRPGWAGARLAVALTGAAGLVIVVLPFAVPRAENAPTPVYPVAAVKRVIPAGACVLTDQESLLIASDRFTSDVPGCSLMVDATGTDYVLGHGRNGLTAGRVPAVAAVWRAAFDAAQYVWLTPYNTLRIAWTPELEAYFHRNFTLARGPWAPLSLYVRNGLPG